MNQSSQGVGSAVGLGTLATVCPNCGYCPFCGKATGETHD